MADLEHAVREGARLGRTIGFGGAGGVGVRGRFLQCRRGVGEDCFGGVTTGEMVRGCVGAVG